MTARTAAATLGAGVVVALTVTTASPALAADGDQATVSVLHAVPGLTVDVYAGDDELIQDFKPGTLTEPMKLDAGSYDIRIFPDGDGPDGKPAIEKTVEVSAGENATIVAHLSEDGTPTLDAYVNDLSGVAAGQARLTVRHDAAAPAVDVRANGTPVFEDLSNPDEDKADVAAGEVEADVVLAGTDDVAIGPAALDLAEGTNTIVYAWGSAQDDNLALKVQTIDGLESASGGAAAGGDGQAAAHNGSMAAPLLSGGALALLGAAGLAARLRPRGN